MKSLTRTLRAVPVLLGLWVLLIGLGLLAGSPVRAAVAGAMRGSGWLDDGHLLGAVLELIAHDPAVVSTLIVSVAASSIMGFLFWIPMAGSLIEALAGHSLAPSTVLAGTRWSLAVAVQSIWSWLARGIVLGILLAITSKVSWIGILLPVAYVSLVLAFDFARTRIVLQDARPFTPMTFLRGWADAFRAPGLLLVGALLIALQLAVALMPFWGAATATEGSATVMFVRIAAFLPLFVSSLRIAFVISRIESEPV